MTLPSDLDWVRIGARALFVLLATGAPNAERTTVFRFATPETELDPPTLRVSVLLCDSSLRCLVNLLESRETIDFYATCMSV